MKKNLIFLFTFLLIAFITNAKQRHQTDAMAIATQFYQHINNGSQKARFNSENLKPVDPFELTENNNQKNSDSFFHIFNVGQNNGFVIVSANDKAKTILGYSDNGAFDINDIPESFKSWLKVYQNEIGFLNTQTESTSIQQLNVNENTEVNNAFASSVSPLLKSIKWNQGTPYNLLCPVIDSTNSSKAVTGCGATALAQVMKYYNWPVSGTGSKSYTTATLKIPLSVDFSKTQFDWANMTDMYNTTSTDVQKNAVATLMYHCGVAVNMDYNKTSSAYTTDIAKALFTYFGYDSNLQVYIRDYYTKSEWENFIKTELNAARPVLYNGQASDGGHIFVCDGYDSNGLFHFNWGWGGASDGYFELSALNPNDLGIGGGNAGGYNGNQYIIKGIQKPNATSTPSYIVNTNYPLTCSISSTSRTGTFDINLQKIYNYGVNILAGNLGLGLFNGKTLVQVLKSANINLNSFYGWTNYNFTSATIPSSIASGTYQLYAIFKASSETNWTIVRGKVGTPNYLNVTVASSSLQFSPPTDAYPKLTLNSFNKTGNFYQNKTGRFTANITNNGSEYNSKITIYLQSVDNSEINQSVAIDPENIANGETKELNFNGLVTLAPGQYDLSIRYDVNNNPANSITWSQLGNNVRVEILPEPIETPALSLVSSVSFPDANRIFKSNAILNATIVNTGGYFENKIIAFIFPTTTGSSIGYLGHQTGIIDQNETKTFSFTGSIGLNSGDYRIGVFYLNSSNSWTRITPNGYSLIPFNLKDDLTAFDIRNYEDGIMYPNPVTDIIFVKSDLKINSVKIFNLLGKEVKSVFPQMSGIIAIDVNNLQTGTYILQYQSEEGIKVNKFIKQ